MYRRNQSFSAIAKMRELKFDPLEKLVQSHERISAEIERYNKIRDGELIVLKHDGKERPYNQEVHMSLHTQLAKIENDLMRYQYARVPETTNLETNRPLGLTINLTPKGGEYKINDQGDDTDDPDFE